MGSARRWSCPNTAPERDSCQHACSRVHSAKVLRLSEDLPVVIDITDRADRIEALLPDLSGMVEEGMMTLMPVRIALYRHRNANAQM